MHSSMRIFSKIADFHLYHKSLLSETFTLFYYPYFPTTNSLICSTISFLLTSYRSVGQRVCDQQMNRGCHKTAYDKIRKVLKMRCVFTLKKDRKAKPKSPQQFTYFTFICRSKLSLYQQFNISYRCIGMTFPSCCSV